MGGCTWLGPSGHLAQMRVGPRGTQQCPRGLENWKCAVWVVPFYPFLCEAVATSVVYNPPVLPGRRDFTGLGSVMRKRKASDRGWTFQHAKGRENRSYSIDSTKWELWYSPDTKACLIIHHLFQSKSYTFYSGGEH